MHPTRWAVLESIKKHGCATIDGITADVTVSPVTVRHHVNSLLADGLVESTLLRSGVGRPKHGFVLTEAGECLFPSRYHVLSAMLLDVLKRTKSADAVQAVLDGVALHLLEDLPPTQNIRPAQRLANLQHHLHNHDIELTLGKADAGEVLAELHCPYYYLGQQHPEICQIDSSLLHRALEMPVNRAGCMLQGDPACKFSIRLAENAATN